ncbi:MAG: M48 family metalloprotease [Acidobacteria bacterium]|nr:M48 family metalloprotease [Acidobacteriota bacterium]
MENSRGNLKVRLVIAVVVALGAIFGYFRSTQKNQITGEVQQVALTEDQEVALGQQAAPQMLQQYGGESSDPKENARVDQIGNRLVQQSTARNSKYQFEFHVLNDSKTINAFALPGGQVFITRALLTQLKTDGQLAGVLGHEIGHVIGRHGAEHMAKQNLTQGLVSAVGVGADSQQAAQLAAAIGNLVNMKYGREDELESDTLGVRFMSEAGYNPQGMIGVMEILAQASKGNRNPEFFSTHPNPENRIDKIKAAIQEKFPQGVPANLEK